MASRQGGKKKRTMKLGQATTGGDRPRPSGLAGAMRERRASLKKSISEDGMATTVEDDDHHEKTCVLCCEDIAIFAKGSCDHVVCFKCSSRMRVLCEEIYCAVCRLDLKKVIKLTRADFVTIPYIYFLSLTCYFKTMNDCL